MGEKIAHMIDHTVLKPEATMKDIVHVCKEAVQYGFASVCIQPCYVAKAAELVKGSAIKVCTVIGFPLGMNTSEVKAFEAAEAVRNGAQEVDLVLHIGALKAGDDDYVLRDIVAVVRAVPGRTVKVILETAALTTEEKERACRLAVQAGAHYVKTSTGFGTGGATVEDVALMRAVVGPYVGVKASGGIRTREDALSMIAAGATRLGTSAGPQLVSDENSSVPASGKPEAY